jgi:hypothetical protein
MEFILFTLVNLVIGLVLYVLFSMRMQAAQEKMKAAHPLQKEVEANIRDGLQSMNAHLEEMHEVRANFYQLLRHAEDVTKRLEDASRKATRKRTGRAVENPPAKPQEKLEAEPQDPHVQRLLDRLGADEFNLSEPVAAPPERSKPPVQTGPGVIDTLGLWAARMFGMKEQPRAETPRGEFPKPVQSVPRAQIDIPSAESPPLRSAEPVQLPAAVSPPPPPQDPNAWIRSLLASGTEPGEISRMTGRSLAEIELIASLPQPTDLRRRTRLSE